jgi:hypothetical protein
VVRGKGLTHVDAHFRKIPSGKIIRVEDHLRNSNFYQMKLGQKMFRNVDKWRLEKLKELYNVPDIRCQMLQNLRENLLDENILHYQGNEWQIDLERHKNFLLDVKYPSDLPIYNMKNDAFYHLDNLSNDKVIEIMKDLNLMR